MAALRNLDAVSDEMGEGTLIDSRIRLHGIPIRRRTEICRWDSPRSFVDQQVCGPYRLWHHEHRFESLDGGTVCSDVEHYAVPGGRLIHKLLVGKDLRRIFEFRQSYIASTYRKAAGSALIPAG